MFPVLQGHDVNLTCNPEGYNLSLGVYKWHKDGRQLTYKNFILDNSEKYNTTGIDMLIVKETNSSDSGIYTCYIDGSRIRSFKGKHYLQKK